MNNFREIAELVLRYGAGVQTDSPVGLSEVCRTLILSAELRRVLGLNGLKLMRDNGGATERHLEIIGRYL
jgi:3-deoxy-D-manno-octulosonic-acid transferase